MKKKLIFFSSQISDDQNFDILKKSLKKNYKILFYNSEYYKHIFNLKFYKNNKKKYLFQRFEKKINNSDLIITGSAKHQFEKNLWYICNSLKKKTLCIVDSWVNLNLRFNKVKLPDYICFPNRKFDKNTISQLKEKCKIFYCGQPYLEKISKINFNNKSDNILYLTSRQNNLEDLKLIKKICNEFPNKKIFIKIHSKDQKRKWIEKLRFIKKLNLIISKKPLLQLIKKTNYTFGIYTMGLLISIIANKKTFINFDLIKNNDYLYSLLKKYALDISNKIPSHKQIRLLKTKKFVNNDIYKNSRKKITNLINDICNSY